MKKTLAPLALALLALAAPLYVLGTTTWEAYPVAPNAIAQRGTFTASNGTDPALATTTSEALGVPLVGIAGLSVTAETCQVFSGTTCTTAGGNMTAGGKFVAYTWNPRTGKWAQVADGSLDLTASAVGRQAWSGFTVTADVGRIAWEPSGIGTSAQLYVVGTKRR